MQAIAIGLYNGNPLAYLLLFVILYPPVAVIIFWCVDKIKGRKMNVKKKNALFGKYPSCDMLNNALRFLRDGNIDCAIEEIIFAIEKADGYFHEDNVQMVTDARKRWVETHAT